MNSAPLVQASIESLLARYERFGVDLGLDRIQALLLNLGSPQAQVPIIHVAGTNGKGSVCAYLAAALAAAGYRVGRYTSPHLVSWCERICINGQPIGADDLLQILQQVDQAVNLQQPSPTQFEVLTAAAWVYFAAQQVDIAVIEVGLGGRLDATNVCDQPLVSIITSLSREHWQRLGPTLADIAREKAGILKPGIPAIIGQLPPEAKAVVAARCQTLRCPTQWPDPAQPLASGQVIYQAEGQPDLTYSLPFPGDHQRLNSALAIAALYCLRQQGWAIPNQAIAAGLSQAQWPGRLQWVTWHDAANQPHPLLIDGAHNPAAAQVLRQYLDCPFPRPTTQVKPADPTGVTWLMGMLSTKDHGDIFQALLRPGDRLYLVPVPGHLSAAPEQLAALAQTICPQLATCQTDLSLAAALARLPFPPDQPTVLCGSLYLVGHFFATQAAALGKSPTAWA